MKKNVAGQAIGAQMVTATDGSEFTSAVTVYVTGDAGTQGIGSVGSGVCTHEGHGYHSYLPSQAETNYDLVAFTFIGTGAVPSTVQTPTTFPQTGDNFARLGAPAGASVSVDVAAVKAVLPAALVSGRMDSSIGAVASGVIAAASFAANALDAVWSTAARLLTAGTNIVLAKGTGVTGFNDLSTAQMKTQITDALTVDTYPESAAVPAATSSLKDRLVYLFTVKRNKNIQTATLTRTRNDSDSADISSAPVSFDGTTYTKGEDV